MILFEEELTKLSSQIRSVVTAKLLLRLLPQLDFQAFKQLRTVELAEQLGTGSGNISRAMAEMVALGVLEREGRGPRTAWRLSARIGWRGTVKEYYAHLASQYLPTEALAEAGSSAITSAPTNEGDGHRPAPP